MAVTPKFKIKLIFLSKKIEKFPKNSVFEKKINIFVKKTLFLSNFSTFKILKLLANFQGSFAIFDNFFFNLLKIPKKNVFNETYKYMK